MIVCDHDTTQLFDPVMDNRPVFFFFTMLALQNQNAQLVPPLTISDDYINNTALISIFWNPIKNCSCNCLTPFSRFKTVSL